MHTRTGYLSIGRPKTPEHIALPSKVAGAVGQTVAVGVGQADVPPAVTIGVHIAGGTVLAGAQNTVGQPVSIGIEQAVVGVPVTVEVDQRAPGVLDAIEPEPAQLSAFVHNHARGHRPCTRPVICERRLRSAVIVEVKHSVVSYPVAVEIRQRVVVPAVTVEIQADRIEPTVTVQVEVGPTVPDGRAAFVTGQVPS